MLRTFLIGSLLFSAGVLPAVPVSQQTAPLNSAAILSEALTLYRTGTFDQALAKYNDILKADAHAGEAYAGVIRCYLKQDKVQEADDALKKALQNDPGNADLKVAEGELLFRQGEIPQAGAIFDEVLSTPPDPLHPNVPPNARAYLGAGRVAMANTMYARAQILIKRAHALDADDPDIQKLWMQTLYADEHIRSLEEYLRKPGNDDEQTRRRLLESLDLLKAARAAKSGRCRPASDITSLKTLLIPLAIGRGGVSQGSALGVDINGKPARLLLDTGASGIVISAKMAAEAGLKPVADVHMGGIGDKPDSASHAAWAESVKLDDAEFHNCPVFIVDKMPVQADGIIGTDVFQNFLIEIDYPTSTFRLSQLPPHPDDIATAPVRSAGDEGGQASDTKAFESTPQAKPRRQYQDRDIAPEMHSYLQAFRIGSDLLIPTTIDEKEQKLFLLDTGAFDNALSTAAAQQVTKIHRAPRIDIQGMNGSVKKVYIADRAVTLDFGHLRQTVPDMVAIDMSSLSRQEGTEISGTLGMVMLHMLKIRLNYRDALVDFQYAPKAPRK